LSIDTRLAQLFELSGKDLTQAIKLLNFKVLIRSNACPAFPYPLMTI
jgi:hypothetical protein